MLEQILYCLILYCPVLYDTITIGGMPNGCKGMPGVLVNELGRPVTYAPTRDIVT